VPLPIAPPRVPQAASYSFTQASPSAAGHPRPSRDGRWAVGKHRLRGAMPCSEAGSGSIPRGVVLRNPLNGSKLAVASSMSTTAGRLPQLWWHAPSTAAWQELQCHVRHSTVQAKGDTDPVLVSVEGRSPLLNLRPARYSPSTCQGGARNLAGRGTPVSPFTLSLT
jgi:hypothetical protein